MLLSRVVRSESFAKIPTAGSLRRRLFVKGFAAVAFASIALSPAFATEAQGSMHSRKAAQPLATHDVSDKSANAVVKAGVPTRVAIAWDCDQPQQAPQVWARADHGKITIKKGKGPSCGRPSINVSAVFYTSNPGFKGEDKLYLLGLLTNGELDQSYTILVK